MTVEDLTQPERLRQRTGEQKLALVAETLQPGASPTQVGRRYMMSTGLLYCRRLARNGEPVPASASTAKSVPVEIVPEATVPDEDGAGAGIELPGERRIRVDRHADAEALRRVLLTPGVAR